MRITQWGDYGILCSIFLAEKDRQNGVTIGASEIAKAHGIAIEYAQQILQRLRKGGIVSSTRGPLGGYKLSRTPSSISILDILLASEHETFEVICDARPLTLERCKTPGTCKLRGLWGDLKSQVDSFLSSRTLADLLTPEREGSCCTDAQLADSK